MIPWVDLNPKKIYCGNITACGIKLALAIAASYKLRMRGVDLVGAYLVTRANKDYPVYIKTPKGMKVEEGYCIQAVGNLYGFPPAGQNFSIEFDKCVMETGYINTPWDLKLFKMVSPYSSSPTATTFVGSDLKTSHTSGMPLSRTSTSTSIQ